VAPECSFFLFFGGAIETILRATITLDAPTGSAVAIQVRAAEKQKGDPMIFSGYTRATPTGFQPPDSCL
jgi:hypothetical protein